MKKLWARAKGPARIGIVAGLIGALLTVIGLIAGRLAPLTPWSLVLGIVIGGGAWGVVSWAIAAAAQED